MEVIPCDDPHNVEVYYVETLPEGRYPGQHAVLTRADEVCAAEFTKSIGLPYDDSVIEGFYHAPSERDWAPTITARSPAWPPRLARPQEPCGTRDASPVPLRPPHHGGTHADH